jgi:hypothetical protein
MLVFCGYGYLFDEYLLQNGDAVAHKNQAQRAAVVAIKKAGLSIRLLK